MSIDDDIVTRHPRGPEENRAAAQALGYRGANSLTVLAASNDPFYKGTTSHRRDAEWFRDLWEQFGYATGVHLRRVHYQTLSMQKTLPDGSPYENTLLHWGRLCSAASSARILGIVDVEAFSDRRNTPPVINRDRVIRDFPRNMRPRIGFYAAPWEIPDLDLDELVDAVEIRMPTPYPAGYEYEFEDDHPTLVEVWVEKSTMNDILEPLCAAERVNLAAGAGFESITHIVELVRRVEHLSRPAHIIYVSDFDPAGAGMPIAVARQIQFWLEEFKVAERVTLETVALTQEQCVEFALPRTPIKPTDKRGPGWELRHGEGATELDALEALHPGEFAQLVRRAIRVHADAGYREQLRVAATAADDLIRDAWDDAAGSDLQDEADRLTAQARAAMAEITEEIQTMIREKLNELEPLSAAAAELVRRAEQVAERIDVALPDRPTAEVDGPADDVLFDSDRHWIEQLEVFRAHKTGEEEAA